MQIPARWLVWCLLVARLTLPWLLLLCMVATGIASVATLSDPAVDAYNMRVGTETFSALYTFTTNTALVETAQAITNMGSDTIKLYIGPNATTQEGIPSFSSTNTMMSLVRNDPSYQAVFAMPFRHYIMWAYSITNGGTTFQSGNYTAKDASQDYNEMYGLAAYLLTNYNNSGKTFYLGHWEGDGYLSVNNWSTNPSPAVVSAMIDWENTRQKAVDDAKAAVGNKATNVYVYYYAEANRVRDAMNNGTNNNVRMINCVIPYITNLDYISYSSYDAMNLSASDLYTTLNYMEAHFPTNKAGKVPGERMWIGEYGWGNYSTANQEPKSRAYIQRLLGWQGSVGALQFILFWEMYNNQTTGGTNFCLIDSTGTKTPCWYLHNYFLNDARLLTAQFKQTNGRLPNDAEFSSLVSPMLNAVLPAPVPLTVSNLTATRQTVSSATVSGTLTQGIYGDDCARVWIFYGLQDGGTNPNAWDHNILVGTNTSFSTVTFTALLTNLVPQTNYYFRFYSANFTTAAWAPATSQFSTAAINPPDFLYRTKITFNGYNQNQTLVNFPVLVTLGANIPGFSYSQFASANGGDLRFTDASGLAPLNYEIDEWNATGVSTVWVQVPALSATNNYIWAYWGNPSATTPAASTNGSVWSANNMLVWHLAHSGFPYLDSAQQYPGISGVAPASATGIIGHGASFDGSTDYIAAGPIDVGDTFTLSAWVNLANNATNIQTILANKASGWNVNGYSFYVNTYNTADGRLIAETGDGSNGTTAQTVAGAVTPGHWHRVTAVVNRGAGTTQLYVDGTNMTESGTTMTDFTTTGTVNLGRFANGTFYFHGLMDEVRIERGLDSSNWISASSQNVTSNSSFANSTPINPRPTLSVVQGTAGPLLSWPYADGALFLYTTANLTAPVTWTLVTNVPALVSGQWQFPLSSTAANGCYYRLQYR